MPTRLKVAVDPDDTDDLEWNWTNRLATGETISTFTAVGSGVTVGTTTIAGAITRARISAGTVATVATVRGRIVTSTGRQLDWTIEIPVETQ